MTAIDETATLLRESAAEFLKEQSELTAHDSDVAAVPAFEAERWRELAQLGWLGLGLPEELGGPGFGMSESAVLCEEFGRVASRVPYLAASVLPAALLKHCRQVYELAPMLTNGERPFAVAWQERTTLSATDALRTRYESGRVSGAKRFVIAADTSSVLLVNAAENGEPVWVAVDAGSRQVRLERFAVGLGSAATVHFDGAPILGGEPLATGAMAERATTYAQQAGRLAIAAQLIGVTNGLLDKTLAYVAGRVQFARPISSFQVIRHRCVDLYIATRLARATFNHAMRSFEAAPETPATDAAISAAKARTGDVAVQVGREAVQMHGGMGFVEEGGLGRYLRAALHLRAWLGAPLEHRRRFMSLRAVSEVSDVSC